ncbi:hypothetical protein GN330_09410 [Nitratireductor sp. CAU 1489]|uniref:Uncharacterized protein n=1 Tax=Nitratireductor arenosus TaxID=2682096 RepID=A0A844QFT1_9HYPH|nr:hypothetical protein [Nitratireductor arenosus]MVA97464.1 hypothetical protein [Nitratireductor arenosus]
MDAKKTVGDSFRFAARRGSVPVASLSAGAVECAVRRRPTVAFDGGSEQYATTIRISLPRGWARGLGKERTVSLTENKRTFLSC